MTTAPVQNPQTALVKKLSGYAKIFVGISWASYAFVLLVVLVLSPPAFRWGLFGGLVILPVLILGPAPRLMRWRNRIRLQGFTGEAQALGLEAQGKSHAEYQGEFDGYPVCVRVFQRRRQIKVGSGRFMFSRGDDLRISIEHSFHTVLGASWVSPNPPRYSANDARNSLHKWDDSIWQETSLRVAKRLRDDHAGWTAPVSVDGLEDYVVHAAEPAWAEPYLANPGVQESLHALMKAPHIWGITGCNMGPGKLEIAQRVWIGDVDAGTLKTTLGHLVQLARGAKECGAPAQPMTESAEEARLRTDPGTWGMRIATAVALDLIGFIGFATVLILRFG